MYLNSREELYNDDKNINNVNKAKNIKKSNLADKRELKRGNYHCRLKNIKNIILLILIIIMFLIVLIFLIIHFIPKKQEFKMKEKEKEINCKSGYYLPVDISSNKQCIKCSVENCQKCYGNMNSNTCISCLSSFIPKYDNYNKISSCQFPEEEDFSREKENEKNEGNEKEYINKEDDEGEEELINKKEIEKIIDEKEKSNLESEENIYEEKEEFFINTDILNSLAINEENTISFETEENIYENEEEFVNKEDILTSNIISEESSIISETDVNEEKIKEVNYTIKTEYFSSNANSFIQFINSSFIDKIIDMKIDNHTINPCYEYFFSMPGPHTVHFLINNNIDSFAYMFYRISKMTSIYFSNELNSKNIKNMEYMFYFCDSLENIDLSNLSTENVLNMEYMFNHCINLEILNLSSFNTEKVTDMKRMFNNCWNLKSIDVSNFNTKNVKSMEYMFSGCGKISSLHLSTV